MARSAPAPQALDTSRRTFLKEAAVGVGAAAGLAGAIIYGGDLIPVPGPGRPLGIDGPYYVTFAHSDAPSSWHNDKTGLPMRVDDFPAPGYGAQGTIETLEVNVVVLRLEAGIINPEMRGVVEPGFAAFNAKCTHLGCTCLWRTREEADRLLPIEIEHDVIVDPCHLCTFDPYDAGAVRFGPPPRPLEQLRMGVTDGFVQIEFRNYTYGGQTPQV